MYKGPHPADYCTRCSASAAMAILCSVDINIVDYIHIHACLYYYIAAICHKRQLKFCLTSSTSTMLLPPL